ncbi:SH3 [Gracilaria domingensis]|nr:SH3 [Gracilaria domingensis]
MWGESTLLSAVSKDSVAAAMNVAMPPEHDAVVFNDKSRKFDEADAAFRALVDALDAYKTAVLHAAECGVAVARAMDSFFTQPDHKQKQLVAKFLDSQLAIRSKWVSEAEKTYDAEVLAPIKSRLDEIPKVRNTIRMRASYKADMEKRQKKLQTERKRDTSRLRDKQRRLKEITNQYTMFHNSVIQSFNYIERNMGTFVTGPLRALVSVMAQVSNSTVDSMEEVVKLVAETPPLTTDMSPAPPLSSPAENVGGIIGDEVWDEDYVFADDTEVEPEDEEDKNESEHIEPSHGLARASSHLPPRGRVHSADGVSKNSAALGGDQFGLDFSAVTSPRRGHSTSSAPAEMSRAFSPATSLPIFSSTANGSHRDIGVGPSSVSGRILQNGQDTFLPPSSVASSTSTENVAHDAMRLSPRSAPSTRRRRQREGKESVDTVGSLEGGTRTEVMVRVVAKYDFSPQETNELELRTGDVVEVTGMTDGGWWMGQIGRSCGYFPRNYTRELTAEEELAYMNDRRRRTRRGHRRHDSGDSRRSGQTASQTSAHLL